MKKSPSILYRNPLPELETRLKNAVEQGLAGGAGNASLFFRADDIGVPSPMFSAMVNLFSQYKIPLNLAVVPSWITTTRYQQLQKSTRGLSLFCWHQHGWRHRNHEIEGKKQEFGDSRTMDQLEMDIVKGRDRLRETIGHEFYPVFTPPWNRCGEKTLDILLKLGFSGVSRSIGATPVVESPLNDFQINVDLHTRKEENHAASFEKLCFEIQHSISSGTSGIMLHHQRMNENSLRLLEILLKIVYESENLQTLDFRKMAA